jgi:hypothetical protein
MTLDRHFLPGDRPSLLSKMDGFLMGLLATPVAFDLEWYDMLRLLGGPAASV